MFPQDRNTEADSAGRGIVLLEYFYDNNRR